MKKDLVIVGAGEFATIAYEYFTEDSDRRVKAFAVERKYLAHESLCGLPVVALEEVEKQFSPADHDVFVAVTSARLNRVRTRLLGEARSKGYTAVSYVSSHAFVWRNVVLGENCFVFENNVLQHMVRVGDNVILWSGNHVGHSSVIRDNCFVASHVVISGYCDIGENSFLGVNATLGDKVTVGADAVIGAGAVLVKSVEGGKIYRGNPAVASSVSSLRAFQVGSDI